MAEVIHVDFVERRVVSEGFRIAIDPSQTPFLVGIDDATLIQIMEDFAIVDEPENGDAA